MPRPDRLFALIEMLRDGRLHRAEDLARRLDVSVRTIYRDMDRLVASGVPIAGERGLGYAATAAVTLPPLNLTADECAALQQALDGLGDDLVATGLRAKFTTALGGPLPGWALDAHPFSQVARGFQHVTTVRAAVRARQKLRLTGADGDRVIRPLALDYWGRLWVVTCWCDSTQQFARLRLDRADSLVPQPQLFVDEPGRLLADYLGQV